MPRADVPTLGMGKGARPRIGVDLGGTKIFGVVLDGDEVTAEAKRKTPAGAGPDGVVDTIAGVVHDLGGPDAAGGVGVGAPGIVDHERGTVRRAPNLPGFDDEVGLAVLLSDALGGAEVRLDNDVNAGVLAEHRMGAARGARNLLGVWVGTGVGGGLVLDGALRRGPSGIAGEIGHTVVHPGGRMCGCGFAGHLEAYAGRGSMEREARERHAHGAATLLVDLADGRGSERAPGRMTSGVWAKALAGGDAVAEELIDDAVIALGAAVVSAVTLLDLSVVVVGGGLGDKLGPSFAGRIEQAARDALYIRGSPLRVVSAQLGDRAGAIGAALMVAAC
jgi:glucokinase